MKRCLALLMGLIGLLAHADGDVVRVGICHTPQGDFGLFGTLPLQEASELSIVTPQTGVETGLNLYTAGIYHPLAGNIELPSYWRPQQLLLKDCQMSLRNSLSISDIPMYLQVYFIDASVPLDADLDQLIRDHDAIPFKVHVICRTDNAVGGPLGCIQLHILDRRVPVDPYPMHVSALTESCRGTDMQWNGKLFLLTTAACSITDSSLHLERQDWARDLAVYSYTRNPPTKSASLKVVAAADWPDQARIGDVNVEVLAASSTRTYIPHVARVAEVLGGEFTPAVRGQALLDTEGGILGLVSDEYLEISPGSVTRPIRWSENSPRSNHLVVIPAAEILAWLNSTLPSRISPVAQGGLKSGHLEFRADCPPSDGTGGQFPIGGVDPVGIGGDSVHNRGCNINVTLSPTGDALFAEARLQSWHDRLVEALTHGSTIQVYFNAGHTPLLERHFFYSPESFFRELLLAGDNFAPIEWIQGSSVDPKLSRLRTIADAESHQSTGLYTSNQLNDEDCENLMRQIYLRAVVAQSEEWKLLTDSDFTELTKPRFDHAWYLITWLLAGGGRLKSQYDSMYAEWQKAMKP